jgi:hypothetical protein
VRSPAYVQNVDVPDVWAREHDWFLRSVFVPFDVYGTWPKIEDLQRTLAQADVDPARAVAVGQLSIDIPAALGRREQDCIRLTVRALSYCEEAAPLLAHFVAVMRMARGVYLGDGASVLSGAAVKETLDLDDRVYRKVSELVFDEPWFFAGGSGHVDGDWERNIRAEVLLLGDTVDVAGYLAVIDRYRFGPPGIESSVAEARREVASKWSLLVGSPRRWLGKRDVSVGDLIAIGVVAAVIAGVILWRLAG